MWVILQRFRQASPARRWAVLVAAAAAVALAFFGLLPLSAHKIVSFELVGVHRGVTFSVGGRVLCWESAIGFPFPPKLTLPRRHPRNTTWELTSGALLVLPSTWMLCETAGVQDQERRALPVLELYDPSDGSGRGRVFLSNRVTTGFYDDLTIRSFDLRVEDDWVTRLDRRSFLSWYDEKGASFDRSALGIHNKEYQRGRHPALVPVLIFPQEAAALRDVLSRAPTDSKRFWVIARRCSEGRAYVWRVRGPDVERIYHMGILQTVRKEEESVDPELAAAIVPLVSQGDHLRADMRSVGTLEMMRGFVTARRNLLPATIDFGGEVFDMGVWDLLYDRQEGRLYRLGGSWYSRGRIKQADCEGAL